MMVAGFETMDLAVAAGVALLDMEHVCAVLWAKKLWRSLLRRLQNLFFRRAPAAKPAHCTWACQATCVRHEGAGGWRNHQFGASAFASC